MFYAFVIEYANKREPVVQIRATGTIVFYAGRIKYFGLTAKNHIMPVCMCLYIYIYKEGGRIEV